MRNMLFAMIGLVLVACGGEMPTNAAPANANLTPPEFASEASYHGPQFAGHNGGIFSPKVVEKNLGNRIWSKTGMMLPNGMVAPLYDNPLNQMLENDQEGAFFGFSVASAGDVNGDGYEDIIIGSPYYDAEGADEGAAFIYYGSENGVDTLYARMLKAGQAGAHFGASVASAGDVNGDGYSDVIVGAPYYFDGENNEGAAFVFYGSETGIAEAYDRRIESNQTNAFWGVSVASAGDVNGDGFDDIIVGTMLLASAFIYQGSTDGIGSSYTSKLSIDGYGNKVASAGDVNGDGYDDVLVQVYYSDNNQFDEGAVFLFHGSATGVADTPDQILEPDRTNAHFGFSISSAGDVNGDGYDDIVVGAYSYSDGENNEGAALVYYGSLQGIINAPDRILERNQADASFGAAVAAAGDVNGDGYGDIMIGSHLYDTDQIDMGAVFFYHGTANGVGSEYDEMVVSDQPNANFGRSLATAGDLNGDGYSDVLVGASYYDNGQSDEGVAFIYSGAGSENGTECFIDTMCASGNCIDNVCCIVDSCNDNNPYTVDSCAVNGDGTCSNLTGSDNDTLLADEDSITADDDSLLIESDSLLSEDDTVIIIIDTVIIDEDTFVAPDEDTTVTPDDTLPDETVPDETVDEDSLPDETVDAAPDDYYEVDTIDEISVPDEIMDDLPDEDIAEAEPVDDAPVTPDEDMPVIDDGQPIDVDKVDTDTTVDEDTEQPDETVDASPDDYYDVDTTGTDDGQPADTDTVKPDPDAKADKDTVITDDKQPDETSDPVLYDEDTVIVPDIDTAKSNGTGCGCSVVF